MVMQNVHTHKWGCYLVKLVKLFLLLTLRWIKMNIYIIASISCIRCSPKNVKFSVTRHIFWCCSRASNAWDADYCDQWSQLLSVCQSVRYSAWRAFAVQIRLNRSGSCLGWRLGYPRNIVLDRGSRLPPMDSMRPSPNYFVVSVREKLKLVYIDTVQLHGLSVISDVH